MAHYQIKVEGGELKAIKFITTRATLRSIAMGSGSTMREQKDSIPITQNQMESVGSIRKIMLRPEDFDATIESLIGATEVDGKTANAYLSLVGRSYPLIDYIQCYFISGLPDS